VGSWRLEAVFPLPGRRPGELATDGVNTLRIGLASSSTHGSITIGITTKWQRERNGESHRPRQPAVFEWSPVRAYPSSDLAGVLTGFNASVEAGNRGTLACRSVSRRVAGVAGRKV
jgi:hypothetical protein